MVSPSAYATLAKLRATWQRVLRNRRSIAELAAYPPSELHRIAQDVGLSQTDLRALSCSHPGPSELMPRRLQQLGLKTADSRLPKVTTPMARLSRGSGISAMLP